LRLWHDALKLATFPSWGVYEEMAGAAASVLYDLATTTSLRARIGFPQPDDGDDQDDQDGDRRRARRGVAPKRLMYEGPYALY
jgi:hypothetical protein